MKMMELVSDFKKPGGKWVDLHITREQKKRLSRQMQKLDVDYEEDELTSMSRSQAQYLFYKLGEIRRENKAKDAPSEKAPKQKKKTSFFDRFRQ